MRIASLVFAPLAQDARVQRTAQALAEAGHEVMVVARPPMPPAAPYACHALAALPGGFEQRLGLVATQAPATLVPALAEPLYWLPGTRRAALAAALAFRPHIVICNDWNTLPIGAALRRRAGAKIVYDSHELATREHIQNWKWRLVSHRAVREIERAHIGAADLVMAVSEGIADTLRTLYGLPEKPLVIRNLPRYRATPFRESRPPLRVLFHGLIRQERGLEELIASMPSWSFEGGVTIRGYGNAGYLSELRGLAERYGVGARVTFAPPVAPDELVAQAATADIGYLVLPRTTEQYEFALPNKLFEYLMAGLPVLAGRSAEIVALLRATGTGFQADLEPASIAAALNGLTLDRLHAMRRAALAAAETLNWKHEKDRLVTAVASLLPAGG
jgi:glycosyltransferase involved in cell wall biosynthesis